MAKITQSCKILLLTSKFCLGCKSPLTHFFVCVDKIGEIVFYSVKPHVLWALSNR